MVTWGPSTTTTFGTSTPASTTAGGTSAAAPSAFNFGGGAPSTPPLTPQTPAGNPPPLNTGFSFGGAAAPAPSGGLFGGEFPFFVVLFIVFYLVIVFWALRYPKYQVTDVISINILTNYDFVRQQLRQLHQEVYLDQHLHLLHLEACLALIQVRPNLIRVQLNELYVQ